MKAGVIGYGNIGAEVYNSLLKQGDDVGFVLKSNGVYIDPLGEKKDELENYPEYCEGLDIAFLAIPTFDNGETACKYIDFFMRKGIPVVTCEKGALGNFYPELKKYIDSIGYGATVGGGTLMLTYLKQRMKNPEVEEVHLILNGTLNFIFWGVSEGRSLGAVVEEARKLGYAEPKKEEFETSLDAINMEAIGDVPKKVSIALNTCFDHDGSVNVRAKDIKVGDGITEQELKKLMRESSDRRYIVSITREENGDEDKIGGFEHEIGGWHISAGFKNIHHNPLFKQLVLPGVNNAVLTSEGNDGEDGAYVVRGPGAGKKETRTAMLIDAKNILHQKVRGKRI